MVSLKAQVGRIAKRMGARTFAFVEKRAKLIALKESFCIAEVGGNEFLVRWESHRRHCTRWLGPRLSMACPDWKGKTGRCAGKAKNSGLSGFGRGGGHAR